MMGSIGTLNSIMPKPINTKTNSNGSVMNIIPSSTALEYVSPTQITDSCTIITELITSHNSMTHPKQLIYGNYANSTAKMLPVMASSSTLPAPSNGSIVDLTNSERNTSSSIHQTTHYIGVHDSVEKQRRGPQ